MSLASLTACGSTELQASGHETSGDASTGSTAPQGTTTGGTTTGGSTGAGSTTGGTVGGTTDAGSTTSGGTTNGGMTMSATSSGTSTTTGGTSANPPATAVLLEDFSSGTSSSSANGGYWYTLEGGGNSDGQVSSDFLASGYTNNGGKMTYLTDSGYYSYTQFVFQFQHTVDLTAAPYSGVFYRLKGLGLPKIHLILYTSLSIPENSYGTYTTTLSTLPADWTSVTVPFDESRWTYSANVNNPNYFTFQQALKNCNGLKWEVRPTVQAGQQGSFVLDDIYFTKP